MNILAFLMLAALLSAIAWVVLAFVIFLFRGGGTSHTSAPVAVFHMVGSLLLGFGLAYSIVLG